MSRKLMIALAAAGMLAPSPGFAYTCWNPAICKAVCGAETCAEATQRNYQAVARFSERELQRELRSAPRKSAVADVLRAVMSERSSPGGGDSSAATGQLRMSDQSSARKGYTCWNPAICIAVCGKKTC